MYTKQAEKKLKALKYSAREIRISRATIMRDLNGDGMSMERIGEIYGCTWQYVQQEIKWLASQEENEML